MRDELKDNDIAALLNTLPRVDAPRDFEYKVRARIAAGRPATSHFPVWAKAAVPLALLAAGGVYFGIRSVDTSTALEPPAVARVEQAMPEVGRPAAATPEPVTAESVTTTSKPSNATPAVSKKPVTTTKRSHSPQGGSTDLALGIGKQLDLTDRPLAEAFAAAGVKGSFEQAGMQVASATGRTGLRAGDVVEAVDGMPVTNSSFIKGGLAGKKLRVRRDGKTVEIVISN